MHRISKPAKRPLFNPILCKNGVFEKIPRFSVYGGRAIARSGWGNLLGYLYPSTLVLCGAEFEVQRLGFYSVSILGVEVFVKVMVKSLLYNLNKRAVRHQFNLRLPNSNISILVLGTLIIRLTSSNGILRFNRSCNNNSPICGLRE